MSRYGEVLGLVWECKVYGGVELPQSLASRVCINAEEGLLVASLVDPKQNEVNWLLLCNVNELRCVRWWIALSNVLADVLASPVGDEVTRFIRGEDVDLEKLVSGLRRLRGLRFLLTSDVELDWLRKYLDDESFRKLRELIERTLRKSLLSYSATLYIKLILGIPRDTSNSLMEDGVVGEIQIVPSSGLPDQQYIVDIVKGAEYTLEFRNQDVYNAIVNAYRKVSHLPPHLAVLAHRLESMGGILNLHLSEEDLSKLIRAYVEAVAESYEKDSVVSRTVRLSDGRKLHIIVPGEPDIVDKFRNTVLLLSNYEIRAVFLKDFITAGYVRHNDDAVKYIAGMREEDLAKLDDETLDTVLELLVQRAFMESVTRT